MRAQKVVLGALLLMLTACTGQIAGEGDADSPGAGGSTRSGGSGGTQRPPDAVLQDCGDDDELDPGAGEIRRLTGLEYANTVNDLLGIKINPKESLAADTLRHGFDNNVAAQAINPDVVRGFFVTGESLALTAIKNVTRLTGCSPNDLTPECAGNFIETFGQKAFRRPLTPEETEDYLGTHETAVREEGAFADGIRRVVARVLSSPHFLYRVELGQGDTDNGLIRLSPWEIASRLSYTLWSSMPDSELFDAAAKGELGTGQEIAAQTQRMLEDPRAKLNMARFYDGWLGLDKIEGANKVGDEYKGYSDVSGTMANAVHAMLDDVTWSGGDVKQLFTAEHTYLNRSMGEYLDWPGADQLGDALERVDLDPDGGAGAKQRLGLFSSPGLMAVLGKARESSPVVRGAFMIEHVLCQELPAPPAGVAPLPDVDSSELTTRQRLEQHRESACASCHLIIDPVGIAFENFDGVGRFREQEKGIDIDASGTLKGIEGVEGSFDNSIGLSRLLGDSHTVPVCLARQWLRYAAGRDVKQNETSLKQLACALEDEGNRLDSLPAAFTNTDAFWWKRVD